MRRATSLPPPPQLSSTDRSTLAARGDWHTVGTLLPYLLGLNQLWVAMLLAFGGLFACGAIVSRVSSRSWWFSGLRQLLFGAAAAVVTFGLGALIGGHLS